MSSSEIMQRINQRQRELEVERDRLRELEKDYDSLADFSAKTERNNSDFNDSIAYRRKKVGRVSEFSQKVRSAKAYSNRADEVLSGYDYQSTKRNIDDLFDILTSKKRELSDKIEQCREKIRRLEYEIQCLNEDYHREKANERRRAEEERRRAEEEARQRQTSRQKA